MKKNLAKKITLSILAGAVLMSSSVVWAGAPSGWKESDVANVYIPETGTEGTISADGTYDVDIAGVAKNNDNAIGGKVTISSGIFEDICVYGGYSASGLVSGNAIKISGGTFDGVYVYGGYSNSGAAEENEVEIIDVDTGVGTTFVNVYGGYSYDGAVNNNKVTLSAANATYDDSVYGGCSTSGSANKNTVTISGGMFENIAVYGGESVVAEAFDNKVVISNVGANSAFESVFGGAAKSGVANSNKVILSADGATYTDVFGGFSDGGSANDNIVTISGGTFDGMVCGGFATFGDATNNTVNISGTADLEDAELFGGATLTQISVARSGATPIVVGIYGGNILNIGWDGEKAAAWTGADTGRVKSIAGFDVINIYGVEWDEAKPHITVDEIELNDTMINAYVSGDESAVNSKKMTLIAATKITKVDGAADYLSDSSVELYSGIANVFTGTISVDETENDIIIKLDSKNNDDDDTGTGGDTGSSGDNTGGGTGTTTPQPERNDQVLVLGESRAAAVAFTNQGSELIETGLDALARDNSKDTKVFAAVYGNHSEYETGSHVNVNGWSGIVGIGKTDANGLTVGAFFENGEGNYSTHNDYNAQYIRGDAEANYNGGGLLVRKDNANGVYTEASLRAGNLQNELRGAVRNGADLTGYDVDTFYYGAHIGIGKVIPRGADGDSLDVYGKFIYTHHDGETFDIGGTATKFDSVESERLRLGFRINEVQTNKLSMYYGAAWEYEFNGDAHDKIASFDLETPSLEGSTVIGEIGMHYKASEKWSFDLNGRAYTGQREGFSGSVQANYAF